MARKYGKISYTPCRTERGSFTNMTRCGKRRKKATRRRTTRRAAPRRATRRTTRRTRRTSTTGYYRDRGNYCRKVGKRGFAKESACRRAGV